MSSWRYPSCDDYRKHQDDAREDARYHSHAHQPSSWDERDCRRAYDDAYRQAEYERTQQEERQAAEQREEARMETARREARQEQERQEETAYYEEQERAYWAEQESALSDASLASMEGAP